MTMTQAFQGTDSTGPYLCPDGLKRDDPIVCMNPDVKALTIAILKLANVVEIVSAKIALVVESSPQAAQPQPQSQPAPSGEVLVICARCGRSFAHGGAIEDAMVHPCRKKEVGST